VSGEGGEGGRRSEEGGYCVTPIRSCRNIQTLTQFHC